MAFWLAAVGVGLQLYGMYRQGKAAKESSDYNRAALQEAIMEENFRSGLIADKIRAKKRRMRGAQTTAYMKAGVRLEGTPLEVLADTAAQFEEDLFMNESDRRLTISRLQMGIGAERMAGKEAMTAAYIGMGSTILQTAGQYYGTRTPSQTSSPYGYWGGPPVPASSGYTPSK